MSTALDRTQLLDAMPLESRIWVYKTKRSLSSSEQDHILNAGKDFVADWTAHGSKMSACVDVLHDHFLVIAADESVAGATGCSIDSSMGFVRQMEQDLQLTLTDRMFTILEIEGNPKSFSFQDLSNAYKEGLINDKTLLLDDLVATKADLIERMRVPLGESWAARFIDPTS